MSELPTHRCFDSAPPEADNPRAVILSVVEVSSVMA